MSLCFSPHLQILPPAQREIWSELHPALTMGLVLYGGTAIALRLGHRQSVDFDFFSDHPLDKKKIQSVFPFMRHASIIQDSLETLTFLIQVHPSDTLSDYVKISFFGNLKFGRVGQPAQTQDGILEVASLEDLMAHKLKVVLQRIESKDYRDIAALLKAKVSLENGLAAAKALYGSAFQPSESLKAMVYFEGGDLDSLSVEDKETLIFAAREVRELPLIKIVSSSLSAF